MQSPRGAIRSASKATPLPRIPDLADLYDYGFEPRFGQTLMIAGPTGSMKSTLGMWMLGQLGLPALVFSADMDAHTWCTRHLAERLQVPVKAINRDFEDGLEHLYEEPLHGSPISVCFDPSPSIEDIHEEMEAYAEVHDAWPQIVVIDNLVNLTPSGDDEWGGIRELVKDLHTMSRATGAAVILMAHVVEGADPLVPAPRSKIEGKPTKYAERVLTIAYDSQEGSLKVAVVKNRDGRSDPTGGQFIRLGAVPEMASFQRWQRSY